MLSREFIFRTKKDGFVRGLRFKIVDNSIKSRTWGGQRSVNKSVTQGQSETVLPRDLFFLKLRPLLSSLNEEEGKPKEGPNEREGQN